MRMVFHWFLVTILLVSASLLLSRAARAEKVGACDWPVPQYKIDELEPTGISKASYDSVMTSVETVFAPLFKRWGCPFVLHRSWSDGTVNAQAWQEWGQCHVEIFGGIARFPGMTARALMQVVCHEIGHHLGGAPYYSGQFLSVEGQADRYSTANCMRRMGYGSVASSLALASALADMAGDRRPSRSTRAKEQVKNTLQSHPRAQCRLDEYDSARAGQARRRCWWSPNG